MIILNDTEVSREINVARRYFTLNYSLIAYKHKPEKQSQGADLKSRRPTELLARPLPGRFFPAVICTGAIGRGAACF